ncbi:DUF4097 family beta strand repeat-containing protein [Nocardioides sp.]|uniref:DUF4097 family beta strand repeat-containing protein n=1 Tax=Nocardioides sp. TaxID=35761 RepID=UPI002B277C8E|nr:DUF4097 family beta strand repeat-containing protein [Nocardioides sp.]
MSSSTESTRKLETVGPLHLHVENGRGTVEITAADTSEATVEVVGPDADDVRVELDGERLVVVVPDRRGGFLSGTRRVDLTITVPRHSDLTAKLGSADLVGTGELDATSVRSGSGDVSLDVLSGPTQVETGSGDVRLHHVDAPLRIKSGSGDVSITRAGAEVTVSTGSGTVEIGECRGVTTVKTGSGDLRVGHAHTDVGLGTGSGDLLVDRVTAGRIQLKAASGDLRVGVPAGIPVWTDVSTVTGRVLSTLEGAGQPEPGADFIEIRAHSVSGDVELQQL